MTPLPILASATPGHLASGHLDPLQLFLGADVVVQVVIAGLLLASLWVWTQIVAIGWRIAALRRRCNAYEKDFWQAADFEALQSERGGAKIPSARVALAGMGEWRRARSAKRTDRAMTLDREGARQRIGLALDTADSTARRRASGWRSRWKGKWRKRRTARRRGSISSPPSDRLRLSWACSAQSGAS